MSGLMDQATQVAEEAARQNKTEEVKSVLNEASLALHRSNTVTDQMSKPRPASPSSIGGSSDEYADSSDSDASSVVIRAQTSMDTVPTVLTSVRSVQPIGNTPIIQPAVNAKSEEAEIVSRGSDPVSDSSIARTPPRLYQPPSVDSIVIDFAYVERSPKAGTMSASSNDLSSSPSVFRSPELQPASRGPQLLTRGAQSAHPDEPHPGDPMPILRPPPQLTSAPPTTTIDAMAAADGTRKRSTHPSRIDPKRVFESSYYHVPEKEAPRRSRENSRNDPEAAELKVSRTQKYRRKPIAREWSKARKRITAVIACVNTALVGLIAGIYAGEVPKIQYQIADTKHHVILGNVLLYIGLGISTLICWPLPLLHGRKPYTLVALAIVLPLQFPQAIAVQQYRSPDTPTYMVGLLLSRAVSGLALGLANINFIATLLDLFGASLQSSRPHQEIVDYEDVRRQGGGMGLWLGVWAWCFVASLAVGFLIGAAVTAHLDPAWGFYFVTILIAFFLLINVLAPETRRAPHRRSILHYFDEEEKLKKTVARGEVKLHLDQDGPEHWWQEVWAGIKLMGHMLLQPGFCVLALYLAWIYALVVLVTLLLGALLSRDYAWRPQYVGLAVFALAVGAALAVPLSKANLFSRERITPPRTDSMTFQPRIIWSSHLVRRCIFTFALPIAGLAFVLTSPGPSISWTAPTIMSALVGFLSCLAVAECIGLVMEAFDTCDLQPGVNSKHRLQSLESTTRRRRTNYSSFPRVAAGLFLAQSMGFFLAAASTGVSGSITRAVGAQSATGIVAGILLFITMLLSIILWRFRSVQVIPNYALGTMKGSQQWTAADEDLYWKPVIIGHPSGKVRRMNILEMGKWSRWTEIRKLNKLSKR